MARRVSFVAGLDVVIVVAAVGCSAGGTSPPPGAAVVEPPGGGGDGGTAETGAPPGCGPSTEVRSGVVSTSSGTFAGARTDGVWSYKGIPYAAPPTGALRFRPPEPAACASGERAATAYGPVCPQRKNETGEIVGSEDCLTLNVWAKEGARGAPVMVFIHGGANTAGSGTDAVYDGSALAARTGAIVVTIEYRLGALGFLTTTALGAERSEKVSGNYGFLDQVAALTWVKNNIAGFGGASGRVMIFGESAGAQDVLVHVVSPLSKGLFSAAIVESGGVYKTTLEESIAATDALLDAVGCRGSSDVPGCLRSKPAEELVAVPSALGPLDKKGLRYGPVVDGWALAANPLELIEQGTHNHVPIVVGSNADETSRMVPPVKSDAEYRAAVAAQYPVPAGAADKLLALYPSSAYPSPAKALVALTTDTTWTCPNRRLLRALAEHQEEGVYRYHFRWTAPGPAGAIVGATHGLELPFVFRTFGALGSGAFVPAAADLALSEAIGGYWSALASTGDPNGEGRVSWPRYAASSDPFLVLDRKIAAGSGLATVSCDLIESLAR